MSELSPDKRSNDGTAATFSLVPSTFDYAALASEVTTMLQKLAVAIRARGAETIIAIGFDLIQAKTALGHGKFGAWLDAEFGWSERTAQNYMRAAEVFGVKSETVAVLPPTVVYRLAAPSTPPAVREQIIVRVEAGERPPTAEIIDLVQRARQEAQIKRVSLRKRKAVQRRAACRKTDLEQHRQRQEQRQAEETAAEKRVTASLLAKFGADELAELIEDLDKTWWDSSLAAHLRDWGEL
jgi:hypothetical protein